MDDERNGRGLSGYFGQEILGHAARDANVPDIVFFIERFARPQD